MKNTILMEIFTFFLLLGAVFLSFKQSSFYDFTVHRKKKGDSWERHDQKTQYTANFQYTICNKGVEISVAFYL